MKFTVSVVYINIFSSSTKSWPLCSYTNNRPASALCSAFQTSQREFLHHTIYTSKFSYKSEKGCRWVLQVSCVFYPCWLRSSLQKMRKLKPRCYLHPKEMVWRLPQTRIPDKDRTEQSNSWNFGCFCTRTNNVFLFLLFEVGWGLLGFLMSLVSTVFGFFVLFFYQEKILRAVQYCAQHP